MKTPTIPGVILAGGQSFRFGSDKREARIRGKRLVELAADCIGPKVTKVYYSIQIPGDSPAGGWPQLDAAGTGNLIPDVYKDAGPLAGIHAALTHLDSDRVLFLPVDLPDVSPATLQRLVEGSEDASICVAVGEGSARLQPLLGVYRADVAGLIAGRLKRGLRSAVSFIEELERLVPEVYVVRIKIPDRELFNVNLSSDLDLATGTDPDVSGSGPSAT